MKQEAIISDQVYSVLYKQHEAGKQIQVRPCAGLFLSDKCQNCSKQCVLCISLLNTGITALTQPKPVTDSTNYWIPSVTLEGNNSCIKWQPYSKHPGSEESSRAFLSTLSFCVATEQSGGGTLTSLPPQEHDYFSRVRFFLHRGPARADILPSSPPSSLLGSGSHLLSQGWHTILLCSCSSLEGNEVLLKDLWQWGITCTYVSCYTHVLLKTTAHWWAPYMNQAWHVKR